MATKRGDVGIEGWSPSLTQGGAEYAGVDNEPHDSSAAAKASSSSSDRSSISRASTDSNTGALSSSSEVMARGNKVSPCVVSPRLRAASLMRRAYPPSRVPPGDKPALHGRTYPGSGRRLSRRGRSSRLPRESAGLSRTCQAPAADTAMPIALAVAARSVSPVTSMRSSPALFGDEVTGRSRGGDASASTRPLRHSTRSGESRGDEAIQRACPVEGHQARHRLAADGDSHRAPLAHKVEVATEVVTKVSNAGFHADHYAALSPGI